MSDIVEIKFPVLLNLKDSYGEGSFLWELKGLQVKLQL